MARKTASSFQVNGANGNNADFKKADGFLNLSIKDSNGKVFSIPVTCALHLDKDKGGVIAAMLNKHGHTFSIEATVFNVAAAESDENKCQL